MLPQAHRGVRSARVSFPLTQPQAVAETSGLCFAPQRRPWATAVLAHGAGSGPDSDVLTAVGLALAGSGVAVLSFAFAYRAAGRRAPDPAGRLLSAWRDAVMQVRDGLVMDVPLSGTTEHALSFAAGLGPAPLLLGGRSMGGRIASLLAAEGVACDGLILLAYPLTARPGATPRTAHWPALRVPALFVTGERDPLCDLGLLDRERPALGGPSDLVVVAGADHSFDVRVRDGRRRADVLDEVAGAVAGWVERFRGDAPSAGGHR